MTESHRSIVAAVLALVLAAAGCGDRPGTASVEWSGTVDTLAGVIVVSNPAQPIWRGADAWRLEEELSIGVVEGDPDYQFAGIADVEIDEAGTIYVLDGRERRVALYDSAGVFVTAFGRQGEGPGEFESPNKLLWRADTLVVWDGRLLRLSYFDRIGTLLRDERAELPIFNRFAMRPDGRVWAQQGPTYWWPMRLGVDGVGRLVAMDLPGQGADTLLTWEDQSMVPVRFEQGLTVVPRWYPPRVDWASDSAGRLFVARGEGYEIEVYSPAGQRIATIKLPKRLIIHRITADQVYGESEDEFEVPYVKRYAIRKPAV